MKTKPRIHIDICAKSFLSAILLFFVQPASATTCTITGNLVITNGLPTTLCGPAGMAQYLWLGPQNNGLNTQCNTVSVPGTYSLTVTDANGYQTNCSVTVSDKTPQPCFITASSDDGGLTTLRAANGMTSYLWHGPEQEGATSQFIIVTGGTYTVTQVDGRGNTNSCNTTLPVCSISGNRTILSGQSTTLVGPDGMKSQFWLGPQNNGTNTRSNTVSISGIYTLYMTDSNGFQNACACAVEVTLTNVTPPATGAVNLQVNFANGSNAPFSATYMVYANSTNGPSFTNPNGRVTWLEIPVGNFTAIAHNPNTFSSSASSTGSNDGATVDVAITLPNNGAPIITVQPQGQTVQAGATATFGVTAAGALPLNYQWQLSGRNINGATDANLMLNFVTTGNSGGYSVIVSNSSGSVTSDVAVLTVSTPFPLVLTSIEPTMEETTPMTLLCPPPSTAQLLTFTGSGFSANTSPLNANRMTVVLTHGWKSRPSDWPQIMATLISQAVTSAPNIVAWDWSCVAQTFCDPGTPAKQAATQGPVLGQALQAALGANYHGPIHFIGHSLGTLVNAAAINYLNDDRLAQQYPISPTPWTNVPMHVTLFDEAEAATDVGCVDLLRNTSPSVCANTLSNQAYYDHPLPIRFTWADNYVTAFGLLKQGASNIILTNNRPISGPMVPPLSLLAGLTTYHRYPYQWYENTITTPGSSQMGFGKSFEEGTLSSPPSTSIVYIQGPSDSPGDLLATNWNDAATYLNQRCGDYLGLHQPSPALPGLGSITARGLVTAQALWNTPSNAWNVVYAFQPGGANSPQMQDYLAKTLQADAGSSSTNAAAYAWIPLMIPSNTVAMSFDFQLQGDSAADTVVAAINGTNVFSLAAGLIETNVLLNSGMIDISALAGRTAELFLGIIGGTATNAILTVQDIVFIQSNLSASNVVDSVGDGIPDSWRAQFFGGDGATTNNLSCAACDPDGDSQNNLAEFLSGTDPTSSVSAFRITSIVPQGDNVIIAWSTVGGHTNIVQGGIGDFDSNDPSYSNQFWDMSEPIIIPGNGDVVTNFFDDGTWWGDYSNWPARYYRIRLVP